MAGTKTKTKTETKTEHAIETHGLTKRFAETTAVDDLDITVESGEVYGFLGPNGAGKSTTINMLLGYIQPTAGTATVLGHDVREESLEFRQRIGILPEGVDHYPRLTGREHLEFVADVKDTSVDADRLLERVGLEPADRTRQVREYSKGMVQRLALGMALVGDPDLLLLDEPSSGLDPRGRIEVREIIRETAAGGTTVFFSSHMLSEVDAVCDRIGILDDGQLVAVGPIEELRTISSVAPVVELQCATAPTDDLGLSTIDGVRSVDRDGRWLTVTCTDRAAKSAVIRHAEETTEITDVVAETASLEQLFESYTGEGSEGPTDGRSLDNPATESEIEVVL